MTALNDQTPFWWSLTNAQGEPVTVAEDLAGERFANQGEADAWIGDVFGDLLAEGVDEVTLHNGVEKVYGPMSLHPGN